MKAKPAVLGKRLRCAALLTALGATAIGCADVGSGPTNLSACERLHQHSLRLRVNSTSLEPDQLAQHRQQIDEAVGADAIARCARDLSERQVSCALAATTADGLAACLPSARSAVIAALPESP